MKVIYVGGFNREWYESLGPWHRRDLAAIHRQGKHLRDRTNHGSDQRWQQAGCKTYDSWSRRPLRLHGRNDPYAHEAVLIIPTNYGFEAVGVRRQRVYGLDSMTGVMTPLLGWVPVWKWHIRGESSTSFSHEDDAYLFDTPFTPVVTSVR